MLDLKFFLMLCSILIGSTVMICYCARKIKAAIKESQEDPLIITPLLSADLDKIFQKLSIDYAQGDFKELHISAKEYDSYFSKGCLESPRVVDHFGTVIVVDFKVRYNYGRDQVLIYIDGCKSPAQKISDWYINDLVVSFDI